MTQFVDPDLGKPAEQLLAERTKRMADALQLKQPDRIPIVLGVGLPAGRHVRRHPAGTARERRDRDPDAAQGRRGTSSRTRIFGVFNNPGVQPRHRHRRDGASSPGTVSIRNGSFQFVEGEYMKPEDYDAFIDDPADWSIRKYWPRVFPELAGFGMLPPLGMARVWHLQPVQPGHPAGAAGRARAPDVDEGRARRRRSPMRARIETTERLAAAGFAPPPLAGSLIEAPFDFMSDTLRGMRGIMLDIHRRPDKLLAAMEKVLEVRARTRDRVQQRHRPAHGLHPAAPRLGRLHVAAAVREVLLADAEGHAWRRWWPTASCRMSSTKACGISA